MHRTTSRLNSVFSAGPVMFVRKIRPSRTSSLLSDCCIVFSCCCFFCFVFFWYVSALSVILVIFVRWDIINHIMANPTFLALAFLVRRGLSVTIQLLLLVLLVVLLHGLCRAQNLATVLAPSVRTKTQMAPVSVNLVCFSLFLVRTWVCFSYPSICFLYRF